MGSFRAKQLAKPRLRLTPVGTIIREALKRQSPENLKLEASTFGPSFFDASNSG
jgi:hypothetical protein